MWVPSHVGILYNKVADGLIRRMVENGNVFEQITEANHHKILPKREMMEQ
jgi:hypothetical protein